MSAQTSGQRPGHLPVLLAEMITALSPQSGATYIDATFGGGGYTRAILAAADCHVIGLDRDPQAILRGRELEQLYPDRFRILHGTFSDLPTLMRDISIDKVDGIVFDFGVSSFQIDTADRGFSFRFEGPLDMRMSHTGQSAADVVNTFSERDLADIIYQYGEETRSRRIARAIVDYRKEQKFETTTQLSNLIKSIIKSGKDDIHPATLTFQALRIFVNNELIEIKDGLNFSKNFLKVGGKLVAVTFHSLEDRLVKTFLREHSGRGQATSRYLPENPAQTVPLFKDVYPRGVTPSAAEISKNPRSRSARLRAGVYVFAGGVDA